MSCRLACIIHRYSVYIIYTYLKRVYVNFFRAHYYSTQNHDRCLYISSFSSCHPTCSGLTVIHGEVLINACFGWYAKCYTLFTFYMQIVQFNLKCVEIKLACWYKMQILSQIIATETVSFITKHIINYFNCLLIQLLYILIFLTMREEC